MTDPIRFFLDEHMPESLAVALRAKGIDVVTVSGIGRKGYSDEEQLRYATADGRVVVTHDTDFLILSADFTTHGELFGGVAYAVPARFQSNVGKLLNSLLLLHSTETATGMANRVEYL